MRLLLFSIFLLLSCQEKKSSPQKQELKGHASQAKASCHKTPGRFQGAVSDMVRIEAQKFMMGTDDANSYPQERPAHPVKLKPYWIDVTEVTNQEFSEFAKKTGYITVAEREPKWEELKKQLPPGTPMPDKSILVPASLVFTPPKGEVNLKSVTWWEWVPGASWKNPSGKNSSIKGKLNFPVTHMAYEDAVQFCKWKNKRLPTEAEWELAARGDAKNTVFAWGNEFKPQGKFMANTFQGKFPQQNNKLDGFESASPVRSFPPNSYGLYDMIGNVWEWTSDFYDTEYYKSLGAKSVVSNPKGALKSNDASEPYAIKRVIKGGSYLCADNYCVNYRPSARLGAAFDSGASHLGFRCAKDDTK